MDSLTWEVDPVDLQNETVRMDLHHPDDLSSVYRIQPLLRISSPSSQSNHPDLPHCFAVPSETGVCIVVQTQIHLFDSACREHLATINLDCKPEVATWDAEGSFLIIGDSLGTIHFLDVTSRSLVFSQEISKQEENPTGEPSRTFVNICLTGQANELVVVLSNQTMFRFTGIDFAGLRSAISNRNLAQAAELKRKIAFELVSLVETLGVSGFEVLDVSTSTAKTDNPQIVMCGSGKYALTTWKRMPGKKTSCEDHLMTMASEERSLKKVKHLPGGLFFLTLNSDETLSFWDARRLIEIRKFRHGGHILDFSLVPFGEASTSTANVAILTEANGLQSLELYSVPTFQRLYTLEVSPSTMLIPSSQADQCVYYLEPFWEDGLEIMVKSLSESVPVHRFQHLVRKRKFEEADEFAKRFQLDRHSVLKAKLMALLQEEKPDLHLQEITQFLSEIQRDDAFVLDVCLKSPMAEFSSTMALLEFATKVVRELDDKPSTNVSLATVTDVRRSLSRLGTFHLLLQQRAIENSQPGRTGIEWQQFRQADLVEVMKGFARKGLIPAIELVWTREFVDEEFVPALPAIVAELPETLSTEHYVSWLRDCVLPQLKRSEDRVKFEYWLEQRARALEIQERSPHGALSLINLLDSQSSPHANVFSSLLAPGELISSFAGLTQSSVSTQSLLRQSHLWNFKLQLEDLAYLREKHHLELSLAALSRETPITLAFQLLDRVAAVELLPDNIESHFRPFCQKKGLQANSLLFSYCVEVMDNSAQSNSSIGASWEERVITIIDCVDSVDTKLDIVTELMRRIHVPWSDSIGRVMEKSLSWTSESKVKTEEHREQYRLMCLKKMLLRYDIKSFNISDVSLAKNLVKYILSRTEFKEAMQDALQVVQAYNHLSSHDAYVCRIQHLCQRGRLAEALSLLKSLPRSDAYFAGQEVVTWLFETLDDVFLEEFPEDAVELLRPLKNVQGDEQASFIQYSEAGAAITELLLNLTEEESSDPASLKLNNYTISRSVLRAFRSVACLARDFGVAASSRALCQEGHGVVVLSSYLRYLAMKLDQHIWENTAAIAHVSEERRTNQQEGGINSKTFKLAEVLGISRTHLKSLAAQEAAAAGDAKQALLVCREIQEKTLDQRAAASLIHVAKQLSEQKLFEQTKKQRSSRTLDNSLSKVPAHLLVLSQRSLSCCAPAVLGDFLDAFKHLEIQSAIFSQTDSGDYSQETLSDNASSDMDTAWGQGSKGKGKEGESSKGKGKGKSSTPTQPAKSTPVLDPKGDLPQAEFFFENGLVLDTAQTMGMVSDFICSSSAMKQSQLQRTKGSKGKDSAEDPAALLIRHLHSNGTFQTALRLYKLAEEVRIRTQNTALELPVELFEAILETLGAKVLGSKTIDKSLSFGYMVSLPMQKSFVAFKTGLSTVGSNFHRLVQFAEIGMSCALLWKQSSFMVDCKKLKKNAVWWHQLSLLGIGFDENAFRSSSNGDYQRTLVASLLKTTHMDINNALEFGRAYLIEEDFIILNYIRLLIPVCPAPAGLRSSKSAGGSRSASQSSTSKTEEVSATYEDYQTRIAGIVDDVDNTPKLLALLKDIVQSISPYNYECLQFVYGLMSRYEKDEKELREFKRSLLVLDVLNMFERTIPATATELAISRKMGLNQEDSSMDFEVEDEPEEVLRGIFEGCDKRVSFTTVMRDPWSVLAVHLNEETVSAFLPLATPLEISSDKMYMLVIQNLVNKHVSAKVVPSRAVSQEVKLPKEVSATIKSLLFKIRGIDLALSTVKWVADQFPCSPDKILAMKVSVQLAEKWVQQTEQGGPDQSGDTHDHAVTICRKLRERLAMTETEFQLRSLGIVKSLDFSKPAELIIGLYETEIDTLIEKKRADLEIDIHAALREIALRHSLDHDKICQKLLLGWLTKQSAASSTQEGEETLPSIHMQTDLLDPRSAESESLRKITFVLNGYTQEEAIKNLLSFAYQQRSQKVTTLSRIRALTALFRLATEKEIQRIHPVSEAKVYLKALIYLNDFEDLHFQQTLKEFTDCNKEGLAKSLWRNHNSQPKGIQLICNLCFDENITDLVLWENALHRLAHFRMFEYLMGVLGRVCSIPSLTQIPALGKLWQQTLLEIAGKPRFAGNLDTLVKRCPLITELDLVPLIEKLAASKNFAMAFRTIELVPPISLSERLVSLVLKMLTKDTVIQSLDTLRNLGGYPALHDATAKATQQVFDKVDEEEWYAALLPTGHMSSLLKFLCEQDRVENLLSITVKAGKLKQAEQVAQLYFKIRGEAGEGEENEGENLSASVQNQGITVGETKYKSLRQLATQKSLLGILKSLVE